MFKKKGKAPEPIRLEQTLIDDFKRLLSLTDEDVKQIKARIPNSMWQKWLENLAVFVTRVEESPFFFGVLRKLFSRFPDSNLLLDWLCILFDFKNGKQVLSNDLILFLLVQASSFEDIPSLNIVRLIYICMKSFQNSQEKLERIRKIITVAGSVEYPNMWDVFNQKIADESLKNPNLDISFLSMNESVYKPFSSLVYMFSFSRNRNLLKHPSLDANDLWFLLKNNLSDPTSVVEILLHQNFSREQLSKDRQMIKDLVRLNISDEVQFLKEFYAVDKKLLKKIEFGDPSLSQEFLENCLDQALEKKDAKIVLDILRDSSLRDNSLTDQRIRSIVSLIEKDPKGELAEFAQQHERIQQAKAANQDFNDSIKAFLAGTKTKGKEKESPPSASRPSIMGAYPWS